jgi:CBS domain-containing protein
MARSRTRVTLAREMTDKALFDEVLVADAMHTGVVTCPLDASLSEVARLMAFHRIHCVVVREQVTVGGAPWGIVSDLDLAAMAAAGEIDGHTAGDSAASPVVMVSPDETLTRAAQLMAEHGTAHVVVADALTAEPVGVLSTLDLAQIVATQQPVLVC